MTVTTMARVVRDRPNNNSNNSRHFSRFVKSCCPTPDPDNNNNNNNNIHCTHSNSYFDGKLGLGCRQGGKVWRCSSTTYTSPTSIIIVSVKPKFSMTSILCLPDDLLYEILSRLPLASLPSVYSVCRRWSRIIDSDSFYLHHHRFQPTLFTFSLVNTASFCTLRLFVDNSWNVKRNDVVSFPDISQARFTVVGRKVFIVNRSGCFIFDPWTGFVKSRSGPNLPRKRFAIASVNGRVYVAGGSQLGFELEEYDPHADEWRVVSHAPRKRYGCIGVGVGNIFYVIGGLKIGGVCDTRASLASVEARGFASSMDLYDVVTRNWLRSRAVPGGGCIVAACGSHGYVYVLASHTVELSFWRFNAKRKCGGSSSSGDVFGEWTRMKGPPLPGQVRLGGTVKFSCVGVENKVVLVQVMGSVDDLLRRGGRNNVNVKEGIVLVFDCVSEEWSRGPDLPQFVQRAACVDC